MDSRVVFLLAYFGLTQCKLLESSCDQIRTFVDGHNSRRLQLARGEVPGQPTATDMKSMVWDDELAAKAAQWADKNQHIHNPDKSIGSGRFSTGENIYWYSITDFTYTLNPDQPLESWFDEYKEFSFRPLQMSDFDDSNVDIGHYTQMAWSDSVYLGCAISQNFEEDWNEFFVVCNYGPRGNYIGQAPYKTDGNGSGELACGIDDCSQPYGSNC